MKNFSLFLLALMVATLASCGEAAVLRPHEQYLAVGTYTSKGSHGIYLCAFDTLTGALRTIDSTRQVNPSYLCWSIGRHELYAVTETEDATAALTAYHFDEATGKLSLLNCVTGLGSAPCHLATNGREIAVAEYGGGSLSRYALQPDGSIGSLLSHKSYFAAPSHIHSSLYLPNGTLLVADLGNDCLYLQQGATCDTLALEAGFGPRHFVFNRDFSRLYVIGELSGRVAVLSHTGNDYRVMQYIACDTTPGMGHKGSADIHLSRDGRFLYASNRLKNDGLAIFAVQQPSGLLALCGYTPTGIHPRNFILSQSDRWLLVACRDSHCIECYERDASTGGLTLRHSLRLPAPVCLQLY